MSETAHQELLDFVYENLEAITCHWIVKDSQWVVQAAREAICTTSRTLSDGLEAAKTELNHSKGSQLAISLLDTVKRIEAYISAVPGELPPASINAGECKFVSKTYAAEIERVSRDRAGDARYDTVGFVDIAFECDVPNSLWLSLEKSHVLSIFGFAGESSVQNLEDLQFEPEWHVNYARETFWLDVRNSLPPMAILVRELKTLRELGAHRFRVAPTVVLVAQSIPEQVSNVLRQEGFLTLSRSEVENLLTVNNAKARVPDSNAGSCASNSQS